MNSTTLHPRSRPIAKPAAAAMTSHGAPSAAACTKAKHGIDPNERHHMIEEAAYFHAADRGFGAEGALSDWLRAQTEIDAIYAGENFSAA